jgi:type II secretory ATPase GspE/PulE/Tfp pilus assembly ATPase PilB-like protein
MAVGLNVVAGPTGSGKSTTLQRNMIKLLQEKNYQINMLTVEDPPEYPIPGARQMPVTNANTEEEKTEQFTKALSAALRSDPDVILVGETRSLSTAELTFQGALSGHGVWTTLHANSAPAIITRLRDMGIQPYLLNDPELVKGLVSQRLFRLLCPACRQSIKTKEGTPEFERLKDSDKIFKMRPEKGNLVFRNIDSITSKPRKHKQPATQVRISCFTSLLTFTDVAFLSTVWLIPLTSTAVVILFCTFGAIFVTGFAVLVVF